MTNTVTPAPRAASRALSKAALTCAAALCASAGLGTFGGSTAQAQYAYDYTIDKLGFTDADHTPPPGDPIFTDRIVQIRDMNTVGQVIGNQVRFNASPNSSASAFFYDPGPGTLPPSGTLTRIGFYSDTDTDHTSNSGTERSDVQFLSNTGYAVGTSDRFTNNLGVPQASLTGVSAWVYFNGTSTRVGLYTGAHVNPSGNQVSSVVAVNDNGTVIGHSLRYVAGGTQSGQSAYIDIGGISERIGLNVNTAGANEHRRTDGVESSEARFLNANDESVGHSNRYDQTPGSLTQIGQSAWFRPGGLGQDATKVGFIDTLHTRSATNGIGPNDGRRVSTVLGLNDSSKVIGQSERYDTVTGTTRGQTAWVQDGGSATPTRIGLFDADHTQGNGALNTGTTTSTPQKINNAGYVVGTSQRYNGASLAGTSAWRYDSDTQAVERLGLVDDEHTGTSAGGITNFQSIVSLGTPAVLLSETGHTAGVSQRFSTVVATNNQPSGQSAWLQKQGSTTADRIGLWDAGGSGIYTRPNDGTVPALGIQGTQSSTVIALNDAAQAVGHSNLYDPNIATNVANSGQAAWFSDGNGNNTRIGLFDFNHTRGGDNFQSSTVAALNADGHAIGTSNRYNGNPTQAGQSGWFFDGTDSIPLVFSTNTSDNSTFTQVSFLSDNDIVLGAYRKFSGSTDLGLRAFLWDYNLTDDLGTSGVDERFFDLGELVISDSSTDQNRIHTLSPDWESLNGALEMSSLGHILGTGTLTLTGGQGFAGGLPFLLTPVPVPEPASVAVLGATAALMLPRRRRSSR